VVRVSCRLLIIHVQKLDSMCEDSVIQAELGMKESPKEVAERYLFGADII
jgi:hypothetical protein